MDHTQNPSFRLSTGPQPDYHRRLVLLLHASREPKPGGAGGPSDDAVAIYKEWGFSLSEITFPVLLAHGTEDKHVPFSFSEYMHVNLLNSTLILLEGDGHYTHLVNTSRSFYIIEGIYP